MFTNSSEGLRNRQTQREKQKFVSNLLSLLDSCFCEDELESLCFSNRGPNKITYNTSGLYMAKESDRMISFQQQLKQWPHHAVDPITLSAAGFFYTGLGDKVKCFSCGIVLGDWNCTDSPWMEHAFWSSECKFVLQQKGSQFVESVKNRWNQHLKMLGYNKKPRYGEDRVD